MTVTPGVLCIRCHEERWPFHAPPGPYTCQRCTEVLRGGHAIDPLPSAAQARARAARNESFKATRQRGKPGA